MVAISWKSLLLERNVLLSNILFSGIDFAVWIWSWYGRDLSCQYVQNLQKDFGWWIFPFHHPWCYQWQSTPLWTVLECCKNKRGWGKLSWITFWTFVVINLCTSVFCDFEIWISTLDRRNLTDSQAGVLEASIAITHCSITQSSRHCWSGLIWRYLLPNLQRAPVYRLGDFSCSNLICNHPFHKVGKYFLWHEPVFKAYSIFSPAL